MNITNSTLGGYAVLDVPYGAYHTSCVAFLCTACIFLMLLGLGNLVVIVANIKSKSLRQKPFMWLLVSLAIADLICSQLAVPAHIFRVLHLFSDKSLIICMVQNFAILFSTGVSLISIAAIAVIRCLAVFQKYNFKITWPCVWSIIIMENVIGIIIAALNTHPSATAVLTCTDSPYVLKQRLQQGLRMHYIYFVLIASTYIVVCLGYGLVIAKMRICCRMPVHPLQEGIASGGSASKELESTKAAVAIMLGFTICFVPSTIVAMIYGARLDGNALRISGLVQALEVTGFTNLLSYTHSAINPFLFIWLSKTYRRDIKKTLCLKCWHPNEVQPVA